VRFVTLAQEGAIMPSHDTQHVRSELIVLLEAQLNVLEKETFGGVTEGELCEYEDRHDRICKLYDELLDRESAA
jgi:hypothetical protein